ncbi:type B carboxylesterase [Mycolicibacterium canariasense]|uniref:Carboxylic ester hydrolase n=1 Tax=Mycolicibacterium canariasense TaxID=228230 RepID=A0A117IA88_MYCCR|nr:carboxylesterase/lipase family protein [Mycolicibacterium canariasense]MCV7207930.1 carboxylesterase/lipase family protein [Mycolicibacterium canariasense]ORV04966.1 carboxylesterase [Mycolicibacterium canariasense]GAS96003.1 type B carboxylesterase [Mycolicibacterium canariasense]
MHEHTVRVKIGSGTIEGFTRDGVHRWRAIPYAKAPVGALRYRAPQPAEPWPGVRYCHGFGNCAPQQRRYTMLGIGKYQPTSEDCLTLNVVAPEQPGAEPQADRMPVMFFIHGGGYIMGSSATPLYDGVALARRGCVYVSVNYRLGALGCLDLSALSTPEHPIEDNLYLRDLILALKWVRENIAAFGGDPDNVTIFGESAGAHAVATLMAVPDAEGLFAQAISQSAASGMVRNPEQAAIFAEQFAGLLGASRADGAAAAMAARPAELLTALDSLISRAGKEMPGAFPVGPTSGTELLPEDPVQAMRAGRAHPIPLIVGSNADEGRLFTRFMQLLPTTEQSIEMLLAATGTETRDRVIAAYPDYPGRAACIRLGGDFAFGTAAWDIAEAHSRHRPTYVYRYDYAPRILHWSGLGATHATELLAVFGVYRTRLGGLLTAAADGASARRVSRQVQARWGGFSRTGNPGEGWPRYDEGMRAVLVFDRDTHLEYDPAAERRRAWAGFTLAVG